MLTRCPACNTWFRIRPEHLQAASGEVQCGRCFTRFNALETLAEGTDVPPAEEAAAPPTVEEAAAKDSLADEAAASDDIAASSPSHEPRQEPLPEVPVQAPDPPVAEAAEPSAVEEADDTVEADTPVSETPEEAGPATVTQDEEPVLGLGDLRTEPDVKWTAVEIDDDWRMDKLIGKADVDTEAPPKKRESSNLGAPPLVELDLPLTLRGESGRKASRRGRRRALLWGLGTLLLLLVLGAQYAYFHRMKLLADYPAARPLAAHLCKRVGCTLPVQRDLSAIRVVNRDVREHPNFAGTLLVNATIVNDANFAQPFPTLQLSLFDTNGTLLGLRRFKPSEYLDGSINIPAGMQPHTPVHVVLEVAGASDAATSFEFRFL